MMLKVAARETRMSEKMIIERLSFNLIHYSPRSPIDPRVRGARLVSRHYPGLPWSEQNYPSKHSEARHGTS